MAAKHRTVAKVDDLLLLPSEIWTVILSRLPVKSILLCRSVCKSWYSLISCPNFISHYSTRNLNKNGNRVLLQLCGDKRSFRSHDESFTESLEHDFDFPDPFRGCSGIVGSCDGLICLFKYSHRGFDKDLKYAVSFLIWNPTIRKIVELPSRNCSYPLCFNYYGFGFDSKTSDYKVLCIACDLHTDFSVDNVCEVFDLRKGVWRDISPLMHPWNVQGSRSECYLNGAFHWSGTRRDKRSGWFLVSFNISDEIFREIRMPDFKENGDGDGSLIEARSGTFGGLVYVIVWRNRPDDCGIDMSKSCSVWAMKEYGVTESWTKLFNIDVQSAQLFPGTDPYQFRLWKNGEVLIVHNQHPYTPGVEVAWDHQELMLYNSKSRKCERLFQINKSIEDVCLYEESLVLM